MTTPAPTKRYHALDALRALALLLGIFYHSTLSLTGDFDYFPVQDKYSDINLALLGYFLHIFRMTTFFVLTGFFSRMLFSRRDLNEFVKDRFKRIILPNVVFWPLAFGSLMYTLIAYSKIDERGQFIIKAMDNPASSGLDQIPMLHLWFLQFLAIYYVAAVLLHFGLRKILDKQGNDSVAIFQDKLAQVVGFLSGRLGIFVVIIPTTLALFLMPDWEAWLGIPASRSLMANPYLLFVYAIPFFFGWIIHYRPSIWQNMTEHWIWYLSIGFVAALVPLIMLGIEPTTVKPVGLEKLVLAIATILSAWSLSFGFIGLCLKFLDKASNTWRYLADSSYWVYLLHLPLIFVMQIWIYHLELPAFAKYILLITLVSLICFGTYHFLVRSSWLGAWLNGRKYPLVLPFRKNNQ